MKTFLKVEKKSYIIDKNLKRWQKMAKADPLKPRFRVLLTSFQELKDFVRNTRSECIVCKSGKSSEFDELRDRL
jgi:hypothetical protein